MLDDFLVDSGGSDYGHFVDYGGFFDFYFIFDYGVFSGNGSFHEFGVFPDHGVFSDNGAFHELGGFCFAIGFFVSVLSAGCALSACQRGGSCPLRRATTLGRRRLRSSCA